MEQNSPRQPLAIQLPETPPKKHGCLASLLVLLALMAGGIAFWVQDPQRREELQQPLESARELWDMASDSLAALLGMESPPLPPVGEHASPAPSVVMPSEEIGGVVTPPEESGAGQDAVSPVWQEDQIVQSAFVEDLAHWLAAQYRPGKKRAQTADIRAANERYGTKLIGLRGEGDDRFAVRASVLRYVFTPSMLEALYALYSDRFLSALAKEATAIQPGGKPLTSAQKKQLYTAYAARCTTLAALLDGIGALPDLGARLQQLDSLEEAAQALHMQISEASLHMADARQAGQRDKVRQLQRDIAADNARYLKVLGQQRAQRQDLARAVHVSGMDEDMLLFMARWVQRRQLAQPQTAQAALGSASRILRDMARRLASADPDAPPVAARTDPAQPEGKAIPSERNRP